MASSLGFREVLALIVGFFMAFAITSCTGIIPEMRSHDVRWIVVSSILVAVVCMAIISYNYSSKYTCHASHSQLHNAATDSAHQDQLGHILEEFALPLGIYVFGAASIMLYLFYLLADFQCFKYNFIHENLNDTTGLSPMDSSDSLTEATTRIVLNLSTLVYFCMQIPFLIRLHHLQYRRAAYKMHHCVLVIACVDVSLWLYLFYKESHLVDLDPISYGEVPSSSTHTLQQACHNMSSAVDIYVNNSMEHFMFPFAMEFMLASLEVLLHVWLLPRIPRDERNEMDERRPLISTAIHRRENAPTTQSSTGEEDSLEGATGSDSEALVHSYNMEHSAVMVNTHIQDLQHLSDRHEAIVNTNNWQKIYFNFLRFVCNLYSSILLGVLEIVLLRYYILNYDAAAPGWHADKHHGILHDWQQISEFTYMSKEVFDLTVNIPTVVFRLFASALPSTVVSLHCAYILSTSRIIRPGASRLNADYLVLALAIGGNIMLTAFEFITCIVKSMEHFRVSFLIGMTEALLYAVQFLAQAMLLYFGQRRLPSRSHRHYDFLQGRLTYLAMFNFMHWFIDSFLEVEFLSVRNDVLAKEEDIWQVIVHICIPACIYFRFISTLLLLRVKRLIREPEQLVLDKEPRPNSVDDKATSSVQSHSTYGAIASQ